MKKAKLLVNTTLNGVFYEAGLEIQVTDSEFEQLVRLGSCLPEAKPVAAKKSAAGVNPFFPKKR